MSRLFRLSILLLILFPQRPAAQSIATATELCRAEDPRSFLHGNIVSSVQGLELSLPDGFKFLEAEAATKQSLEKGISIENLNHLVGFILHESDQWHPDSMSYLFRLSYLPCGYIPEEVFDEMDTKEIGHEKEEMIAALSEQLVSNGGTPIAFTGWQDEPRYDKMQHCLYWAQEQFTSGSDKRYADWHAVKLGANMILRIDVNAPADSNSRVRNELSTLVSAISFRAGDRYEDFDRSSDKESDLDASDLIFQREKSQSASNRRAFLWQTGIALFMILLFAVVVRIKRKEL